MVRRFAFGIEQRRGPSSAAHALNPDCPLGSVHGVVLARFARNRRLADACYLWAFAAITASPGARAFYDERRAKVDTPNRALRALANRLVGILHGCLASDTTYDEFTAWGHRQRLVA
jgi:hypothetical protein